jgi:hypothetical protein
MLPSIDWVNLRPNLGCVRRLGDRGAKRPRLTPGRPRRQAATLDARQTAADALGEARLLGCSHLLEFRVQFLDEPLVDRLLVLLNDRLQLIPHPRPLLR